MFLIYLKYHQMFQYVKRQLYQEVGLKFWLVSELIYNGSHQDTRLHIFDNPQNMVFLG